MKNLDRVSTPFARAMHMKQTNPQLLGKKEGHSLTDKLLEQ